MNKFSCFFLFLLFSNFSQLSAYNNPVNPGFLPDPSVCRVGEDYYLVNSSFEYFPGVPIFHSKDLIHWQQIGNVLDRPSQLPLQNTAPSDGIYAPTLRYHDGIFYMIVTNVNGASKINFFVTATNPAGPWSEPIILNQSGIDPSLFWDEDGKVYFVSNRGLTFNTERAIYQSEIDIKTGKRLTEPKIIWKGSGGSYVEGPHMYKKDGYYYLQTAEGGTQYGHMVCISRSKNIWGPYDSNPKNPILSNRYAYEKLYGTGHADMIQAHDGSWWMVHLAFRTPQVLGRETCLAPLKWDVDGWPVVNSNGTNSLVNNAETLPLKPFPAKVVREDFNADKLGFEWISLRNPDTKNYSLSQHKGFLMLFGSKYSIFDIASPTFVGRRQAHFDFDATTLIDFTPKNENEEAGMLIEMTNRFHYQFVIDKKGNQRLLKVLYTLGDLKNTAGEVVLKPGLVSLRIKGDKKNYSFQYSQNNEPFQTVGKLNIQFLSAEVTGGYNGVVLGLYATGNGVESTSSAAYDWFDYEINND
ncbi:MAG: glycoside hydrolase family 43 protein [Paludibacter sp.]